MRLAVWLSGLLLCGLVLPVAFAQSAGFTPRADADRIPSYELVSIHKVKDGAAPPGMHDDPDGFTAGATSLRALIAEAYGFSIGPLSEQQLLGGPEWAKTQLYDIHAKVDEDDVAKLKELRAAESGMAFEVRQLVSRTPTFRMVMLQRMLEERFRLKVHYEQRVVSLYEMTLARGGVRMKAAHPADPEHGSMSMIDGKLVGDNVPMAFLAMILGLEVEKPVEDNTGVSGNFDFELRWTRMDAAEDAGADVSAPSLFTAVQEQMGLKLQPGKGPVWVVVVDHAEMPSEN